MSNTLGWRGYKFCRQHRSTEPPWLRIKDLGRLSLPRPVALVNGAFDLLHAGHMKLFFAAADNAKSVICALDSDHKVIAAKGRLCLPWHQRAVALKYMPVSGLVEIDSDQEFLELVRVLRPDFRVLSTEYFGHKSRCPRLPVLYVPDRGLHTSDLIEMIKNPLQQVPASA